MQDNTNNIKTFLDIDTYFKNGFNFDYHKHTFKENIGF